MNRSDACGPGRDTDLLPEIRRVYEESNRTFGARMVWIQLRSQGVEVARCTVERLMRQAGLTGLRGAAGLRLRNSGPVKPDYQVAP